VPGRFSKKNYAYRVEFRVLVLAMLRAGAGHCDAVQRDGSSPRFQSAVSDYYRLNVVRIGFVAVFRYR
jgi:hypothetical protein